MITTPGGLVNLPDGAEAFQKSLDKAAMYWYTISAK